MKENLKLAWIAVWFTLVGQLALFVGVSIVTGEWRYGMWSFMVSMLAGVPSLILTLQARKNASTNKIDLP
ncbi:hypothetical protein PCCS19_05720 [Paenibacillus sp. CCS19]|uniref:hypothetical protein n=1 Tax=Paenibacillus sp. CCS19 TaxID=3158387 RepID=UPI0025690135|nr:hypothetical protein [Paenibacillus cellulosilyticus]GMK37518.1 hypothetical protein PCCS19_05720 [Paenibacillus cellulosilyticus]